jgi:hypothetical protein
VHMWSAPAIGPKDSAVSSSPKEYLDGLRKLCRLATRHRMQFSEELVPNNTWALLRVQQRASVMAQVHQWLKAGPAVWIDWAARTKLTQNHLESEYGSWPNWLKPMLEQLPYALGPVGIRRQRKPKTTIRMLRKQCASRSQYSETRAAMLLGLVRQTRGASFI